MTSLDKFRIFWTKLTCPGETIDYGPCPDDQEWVVLGDYYEGRLCDYVIFGPFSQGWQAIRKAKQHDKEYPMGFSVIRLVTKGSFDPKHKHHMRLFDLYLKAPSPYVHPLYDLNMSEDEYQETYLFRTPRR